MFPSFESRRLNRYRLFTNYTIHSSIASNHFTIIFDTLNIYFTNIFTRCNVRLTFFLSSTSYFSSTVHFPFMVYQLYSTCNCSEYFLHAYIIRCVLLKISDPMGRSAPELPKRVEYIKSGLRGSISLLCSAQASPPPTYR